MAASYPIVQVQPEWVLEPEQLGTKIKFWYAKPDGARWLFKHVRANTGEHWSEKIAAEVAAALRVDHAAVELAEFGNERGSASKSFLSGGQELTHGNEIMGFAVDDYDRGARRGRPDHTLRNIWKSFDAVFRERRDTEAAKRLFAGYMVLDAVIGNTDRHHENWGLRGRPVGRGAWDGGLAPSFDHASSLSRELLDEKRTQRLAHHGGAGPYSEKGRGGVYWSGNRRYGPSPLALVRAAVDHRPDYFAAALARLGQLTDSLVGELVERVPSGWMSPLARRFAAEMITYNRNELQNLA